MFITIEDNFKKNIGFIEDRIPKRNQTKTLRSHKTSISQIEKLNLKEHIDTQLMSKASLSPAGKMKKSQAD